MGAAICANTGRRRRPRGKNCRATLDHFPRWSRLGKVGGCARGGIRLTFGDANGALRGCLGQTEAPGRLGSALKLQKLGGKQLRGHRVRKP